MACTYAAIALQLLDESDWDIYYWATEKRSASERWASSPLLTKLQRHARNEGKEIRRMPDISKHGVKPSS